MRILVVGGSGFIGTHFTAVAAAQGVEVVSLSRNGILPDAATRAFAWSFGEHIPATACQGVSCAVHLAHDFGGEDGANLTRDATIAVATQLQSSGIERQIFFSSYSASENAVSLYGRTKYSLEQTLGTMPGIVIVRPGLVMGDGGIYGRIRKWARALPLIPLPDGGRGKVPVIEIRKLCELTLDLALASMPPREANLFEHEMKSLRWLVLNAAAEVGRHPWIIPMPTILLKFALNMASIMRIPLPVNADNLAGFMGNQSTGHVSTLDIGEII